MFEFMISTYLAAQQARPDISALINNNTAIVWQVPDQDGDGLGVFGQLLDSKGSKIGSEFSINTYKTRTQNFPKIASLGNNGFIVTWQSIEQIQYEDIFAKKYDINGNPSTEFSVNTHTDSSEVKPDIASISNGNFMVVWNRSNPDPDSTDVYARRYTSSASPLDASDFRVNTYTDSNQYYPVVTGLSNGNFVVAWSGAGPSGIGVYARRFSSTSPIDSSEFKVNEGGFGTGTMPFLTKLNNGGYAIGWSEAVGSDWLLCFRLYDVNNNPGSIKTVKTFNSANGFLIVGNENIVSLNNGDIIVTYAQSGPSGVGTYMYGKSYDPYGYERNEFPIDTDKTSNPVGFNTVALSKGGFINAWGADHIYGLRYDSGFNPCGDLIGDDADNTLAGTRCDEVISGLGGNDILEGKGGADYLNGGTGSDTANYANSSAAVVVNLTSGVGQGGDAEGDTLFSIENIIGSNYCDNIIGDNNNNKLEGKDGDDILENGGGTDILVGGSGKDIFKITNSPGNIEIIDFVIGEDKLDLSQFTNIHNFNELQIETNQGNAKIILPNVQIVLDNISQQDFNADCVVFSSADSNSYISKDIISSEKQDNNGKNWCEQYSATCAAVCSVGGTAVLAAISIPATIIAIKKLRLSRTSAPIMDNSNGGIPLKPTT